MDTDAAKFPELTSRQEQILAFIVRTYTQKPEPISSKYIYEQSDLGVSSATIRNEMVVLDELGYITAPHKSAGRIPTQDGYRYFVSRLLKTSSLSENERQYISEKFQALPMVTEQWMRLAANVLARTAQTASLVTAPVAETTRFKHIQLISIQGRLVLMVLVLHGGIVQQRMLNLAEPVPQETLQDVVNHINTVCADLYAHQIRMKSVQLDLLEREVVELAAEVMEQSDSTPSNVVYRDGLSEVISSFQNGEGAQQAIRVFEERSFLDLILNDFLPPLSDDVQVIVAGDGRIEEISQLSMVLSLYGLPGQMRGTIGVLGPTHINYGRAISTVRYVSSLMTNMMAHLYDVNMAGSEGDDARESPTDSNN